MLTKKTGTASGVQRSPFVHSLQRGLSHALPTMDRRAFLRRSGLGVGVGIAASSLTLVKKARAAEGGAAGVIKSDDSMDHHFHDTVGGGDWLSDQDAVDYFIREAPLELLQLEHWGCPWSREANGSVAVRPFGGMKKQRTWFAADKSGFHILHTLFQTSLKFPSIQRFDEYYVTDLVVEDGHCRGFTAIEMRSGQMKFIRADAVIIASEIGRAHV